MAQYNTLPQRFIGLDIHKHYFVAAGVNARQETVLRPQRVNNGDLETWLQKTLTAQDAIVLEMTTNTYEFYDTLLPHVHSVTVVHPPHVALITRAQVKTDRKAALGLAQLHAAGLLVGIWIPPHAVRDLRALVAQRTKLTRLQTQAKNRLHALLHRQHLTLPEHGAPFAPAQRAWWEQVTLTDLQRVNLLSDLDTLHFAQQQVAHLTEVVQQLALRDERTPLLVQLPGIGLLSAVTLLAAIGDITRFESAKHLVGYAGLGSRVHDSGLTHTTGRITKAGRRDLRYVMIEAAHSAVRCHPHWQAEFARLAPRLGEHKAIVAIARKLLVAVWHVLSKQVADRFAEPTRVAQTFLSIAYRVGGQRLPDGLRPLAFTRQQLDRLQLGADLKTVPWGRRQYHLPPSRLTA
jgi:transposase